MKCPRLGVEAGGKSDGSIDRGGFGAQAGKGDDPERRFKPSINAAYRILTKHDGIKTP